MPDDFPFEELTNALVSAFPDYDTLNLMTTFKLGTPLANIAPPGPQPVVVLKLITWAKSRGRVDDLIVGAQNQTPENPELIAVAEQFSLDEGAGEFERIVKPHIAFADVDQWRADMMRCERAVCRIEFGEEGIGTGFLVGTDVVVTNYHVMQDVVDGAVRPEDVGARFDYKMKPGGKTAQKGKSYKLAKSDWLIAGSPPKELDYALIRLRGKAASDAVEQYAPSRGFLRPVNASPQVDDPLFIIQHPKATPLKFAPGSVEKVDDATNRIYYSVNTEEGSSGSPCFTSDWNLVALHHWGSESKNNRGVMFGAILRDWNDKGVLEKVGV